MKKGVDSKGEAMHI